MAEFGEIPETSKVVPRRTVDEINAGTNQQFHSNCNTIVSTYLQKMGAPPATKSYFTPSISEKLGDYVIKGDRDGFLRTANAKLTDEQAIQLLRDMEIARRRNLETNLAVGYAPVHGTEQGKEILREGKNNANELKKQGDLEGDPQTRFLIECGKKLTNDQQKQDMLMAALEVGFTAASIFAAEMGFARPETANMSGAVRERVDQLMREMRDELESLKTQEDPKAREEYDRHCAELEAMVGPRHAKEAITQLERQDGERDDLIKRTLDNDVELARRLHQHELRGVSPRMA